MIEVRVRRAVRQGRVYWRVYPDASKPQYLRVWSEPAAERVASDLRALHAKHAAEDLAEQESDPIFGEQPDGDES